MIYGFMDESGTPGISHHNNEFLLATMVLFDSEDEIQKYTTKMDALVSKLHLPKDYEFHFHSNSTRPQTEMLKLLHSLHFKFITIAIRKHPYRKIASYEYLAKTLAHELSSRFPEIKIEMDKNPMLYKEMKKYLKTEKLKEYRISERSGEREVRPIPLPLAKISILCYNKGIYFGGGEQNVANVKISPGKGRK